MKYLVDISFFELRLFIFLVKEKNRGIVSTFYLGFLTYHIRIIIRQKGRQKSLLMVECHTSHIYRGKDDMKKSFWKKIHFGRVVVWCVINCMISHFLKHPFGSSFLQIILAVNKWFLSFCLILILCNLKCHVISLVKSDLSPGTGTLW